MSQYRLGRLTFVSMEPAELFRVNDSELRHVVTVNADIFVVAHEEPVYGALLRRTWNTIDGRTLQWLATLMNGGPTPRKLSGSELLEPLAAHCQETGQALFILGGTDGANTRACKQLQRQYPRARISGYAPPFTEDIADESWNAAILDRLGRQDPTYLVLAFGSPKGDYWIDRMSHRLYSKGVRFAAGFGGAVNFAAGLVPRAPRWVRYCGLEWLFRLLVESGRFRRTLRMLRMPYHAFRDRHAL